MFFPLFLLFYSLMFSQALIFLSFNLLIKISCVLEIFWMKNKWENLNILDKEPNSFLSVFVYNWSMAHREKVLYFSWGDEGKDHLW